MIRRISRRRVLAGAAATFAIGRARSVHAAASSPGISAGEIKLGIAAYYSGPASTAAAYGQAQVAYFQMVNDRGGINGRKVKSSRWSTSNYSRPSVLSPSRGHRRHRLRWTGRTLRPRVAEKRRQRRQAAGSAGVAPFALPHGAGNGILTIARGTLPLAIFGPENYAYRLGLVGAPSRVCQALAPLAFELLIAPMGPRRDHGLGGPQPLCWSP